MDAEPTTRSIWSFLDGWSIVPAYIEKIERKHSALEKSNEAKLKKISELRQENTA